MNINKVILVGHIANDIELKQSRAGKELCNFSIAINRKINREKSDFIDCTAFGKTAENIAKYFCKGSEIAIIGEIHVDEYTTKEGAKRRAVRVYTNEWFFGNKKSTAALQQAEETNHVTDISDEDLPF